MSLRWLPDADAELEDAVAWYDAQQAKLGDALLQELSHAIRLIEDFPDAGHPLTQWIRQKRLNRFPCAIVICAERTSA